MNNKYTNRKNEKSEYKKENRRPPSPRRQLEEQNDTDNPQLREDLVIGRTAVLELLKSGREIECIYVTSSTESRGSITAIVAKARDQKLPIKEVSPVKLDYMSGKQNHQGIIAVTASAKYSEMEDIYARAEENGPLFVIVLDEISDPHNLGAIARTAEAAGAHGIIIPKRGSVGLTAAVFKTSAGAVEHIPVVRVSNIVAALKELKDHGAWVYAADMDGKNWSEQDFSGPVALVVGAEGKGVSRLIKENCDFVVSLPMNGKVNSLNASVAAGIVMYEVVRSRLGK